MVTEGTSNLAVIQRYQARTLRQITDAPWYVTNHTLHTDLRIPPVRTVFQELAETHRAALKSHPIPPYSTNPRTAEQKAITKKMDARCELLRERRWTSPSLSPKDTSHYLIGINVIYEYKVVQI